ncbi:F-box protein SKIP19-like [Bidens hawaiensis]|uniref:F-box protein SKIP19-like n=1 Tax=Bidens hawaiensis TaxID=980011 RepID=UPI004049546F
MKRRKGRKQRRNWLKLPNDVMTNILYRVGVIDILENAQKVLIVFVDAINIYRSSQLRRLEIAYCYGCVCNGWDECMEKFVKLEELSLHTTDITEEAIEVAGRCCPLLKTLKMNNQQPYTFVYDDTVLAIGKNLPELRHLELIGSSLSNIGLQAILDGCGHLESLDLRQCFHIDRSQGRSRETMFKTD